MKKIFTTLVTSLLMLSTSAPALAMESTTTVGISAGVSTSIKVERKQVREEFKEKEKGIRDEFKEKIKDVRDELKDKMKEVREELRKKQDELKRKLVRRELTLRGELTAMSGTAVPATLTIKVSGVWPDFHAQWQSVSSSTFPVKDGSITVKVDEKTKVVRRYNGKSSLDEFTVGDAIQIVGHLNNDGTISARVAKDNSIHVTFKVHHGIISSLDAVAKSFMMTSSASSSLTFTVKTNSTTKFQVPGVEKATFNNLKVSDKVWVRGVINTRTKVIDANVVKVQLPKIATVPTPTTTPSPTPTSTATST